MEQKLFEKLMEKSFRRHWKLMKALALPDKVPDTYEEAVKAAKK